MPEKTSQKQRTGELGLARFLWENRLNWLLLLVPASIAIELLGLPKLWLFIVSAVAIMPLAGLIGQATEEVAHRTGPSLGGFLNATFGNATELIIALFALRAGLHEVVKASISGSIIGNILLVLGLSMLMGGWGRLKQNFNQTSAGASAAMLFLAVVALVMPAVFDIAVFGTLEATGPDIEHLSLLVAAVLMAIYLASLLFSLKTHRALFTSVPSEHVEQPRLGLSNSVLLLFMATVVTAVEAELLVSGVSEATAAFGMTEFFVGAIVVAVVGNAAEHGSAVLMAMKNRMDLAVTIATGSGTQIALFVAPVLVFASFLLGHPMSLVFNAFEIVGVALSVLALSLVSLDGRVQLVRGPATGCHLRGAGYRLLLRARRMRNHRRAHSVTSISREAFSNSGRSATCLAWSTA